MHFVSLADFDTAIVEGSHPVIDDQLSTRQRVLDRPVPHLIDRDQSDGDLQAIGEVVEVQIAASSSAGRISKCGIQACQTAPGSAWIVASI